jgi:hypothetical protein
MGGGGGGVTGYEIITWINYIANVHNLCIIKICMPYRLHITKLSWKAPCVGALGCMSKSWFIPSPWSEVGNLCLKLGIISSIGYHSGRLDVQGIGSYEEWSGRSFQCCVVLWFSKEPLVLDFIKKIKMNFKNSESKNRPVLGI